MIRIQEIKNGNKDAFQKVYQDYNKRLYDFIYSKTGSDFYASEVVQMTFLKLWDRRQSLHSDIALSNQVYQIAKSVLIDVLRKTEKERLKRASLHRQANSKVNTGYERIEEREVQLMLEKALAAMPPVRKKVFSMKVQSQLSYKEISSILSISTKTVNKHMELAMQQIKPFFRSFFVFICILISY
ncbi:MAG: sigma-70 family RNA polymerase sigma factor [Niabella sp.]|nr:sigma-70 family RNA polymerase sigma factor [Niabella sp.]